MTDKEMYDNMVADASELLEAICKAEASGLEVEVDSYIVVDSFSGHRRNSLNISALRRIK